MEWKIDWVNYRVQLLQGTDKLIMKNLDDILADQQTALTKISGLATVEEGVAALVTAQKATLADLQAQLAAALANGDPAKIQAVADNMQKINDALDAEAAAQAVIVGTPAAE